MKIECEFDVAKKNKDVVKDHLHVHDLLNDVKSIMLTLILFQISLLN